MRSTSPPREDAPDDRTARARIRDAALELFAERGVHATSIRDIAEHAGVSPGLVQHHFGSKEGLREACDAHAIETVLVQAQRGIDGEEVHGDLLAAIYAASGLSIRYVARALVDDSPAAARMFDAGATMAEKWLANTWPERFAAAPEKTRQRAAAMAAMHLGTIVLHTHLARRIGVDPLERDNQHIIGASMVDIYTCMGEWLGSRVGGQLRDALAEQEGAR